MKWVDDKELTGKWTGNGNLKGHRLSEMEGGRWNMGNVQWIKIDRWREIY